MLEKKFIIAGPDSFESRDDFERDIEWIKKNIEWIKIVRGSLYKPRSQAGWDGVGTSGAHALIETALKWSVIPATEVMLPEHALAVIKALKEIDDSGKIILWLGSRNQNHLIQQKIAHIINDGPPGVQLMVKNPPWADLKHFLGIISHITQTGGLPIDRVLLNYRGFDTGLLKTILTPEDYRNCNPHSYRNISAFDIAEKIRMQTQQPILLDPSHIAGSRENVFRVVEEAVPLIQSGVFNGLMVEVTEFPEKAKVDGAQQLSQGEFVHLIELLGPYITS